MASPYDDILPAFDSQTPANRAQLSPYDDLLPQPAPIIGHQLERWDPRRTGGPPSLSRMAEAFGKELMTQIGDLDRGARQMFNLLPFGSPEEREKIAAELQAEQATADSAMADLRAQEPTASALGAGAQYALFPQRMLPSMALGAGLEALKYGTLGERAAGGVGGALGGALAYLGGALGRNAVQPTPGAAQSGGLQDAARRLGAPLTAGQRSLDPRTLAFEDYLRRTPFGSIPFEHINRQQAAAVNRAAGRAIGEQTDALTQPVLDAAESRITQVFDDIMGRNELLPHTALKVELDGLRSRLASETSADIREVVMAQLEKYTQALLEHGRKIPGDVFRTLTTSLNRLAKRKDDLGYWTRELRDIMRRGMGRNLPDDERLAWQQANQEYRNLMTLIERPYNLNEVTGDVAAKNVWRTMAQQGRGQKLGRNTGDMADIADFGRGLPPTAVGSQTAPRQLWQAMRENPVQAMSGLPAEYLPAWILARGGLFNLHPAAQAMVSPTLGMLGSVAPPSLGIGLIRE